MAADRPLNEDEIVYVTDDILDCLYNPTDLMLEECEGGKINFPKGRNNDVLTECEWDELNSRVKMTERQKECMKLYYWEGKTLHKVGEQLQISFVMVHYHLRAVRRKMIKCFNIRST